MSFFFSISLELSLVEIVSLHNTPGKGVSSLPHRHLTDIQAQAQILGTSQGTLVINYRWGCKGGATPHLPCPGPASNTILGCFCSCVCSRDHRSSWGTPLLLLSSPGRFPRSKDGDLPGCYGRFRQRPTGKGPQCYSKTNRTCLWSLGWLWF